MEDSFTSLIACGQKFLRHQIPLELAFASTIHKAQGITCSAGVVLYPSPTTPRQLGLEYVGLSRATHLNRVFLMDLLRKEHFVNHMKKREEIDNELTRLISLTP